MQEKSKFSIYQVQLTLHGSGKQYFLSVDDLDVVVNLFSKYYIGYFCQNRYYKEMVVNIAGHALFRDGTWCFQGQKNKFMLFFTKCMQRKASNFIYRA